MANFPIQSNFSESTIYTFYLNFVLKFQPFLNWVFSDKLYFNLIIKLIRQTILYTAQLYIVYSGSAIVLMKRPLSHYAILNLHFYTPFKKVTQHHFDRLYQSVYGVISIMVGIIWKLDYLSFHWYFICHDWFAGMCAARLNWAQCKKKNVAKLDHNINRWYHYCLWDYNILIV